MEPLPPAHSKSPLGPDTRPSLALDREKWLPFLSGIDLPEDQKSQFIEVVWNIVVGVLDADVEDAQDLLDAPDTSPVLQVLGALGRRN